MAWKKAEPGTSYPEATGIRYKQGVRQVNLPKKKNQTPANGMEKREEQP